jgi:hypothetical protein
MISTEAGHTETLDEFGVDTNIASAKAITTAQRLQKVADNAMGSVESLESIDLEQATVQATLLKAEASLVYVRKNLGSIKREAAMEHVDKIKTTAEALERSILKWRLIYPDTSPVKIDNSEQLCITPKLVLIKLFQANTLLTCGQYTISLLSLHSV